MTQYYTSTHKRLFDILLSTSLLILLLPLMFLISLIILLQSGRPIIFQQKRTGFRKETFTIYKFRTMYPNAQFGQYHLRSQNQAPEPMFKLFDDPRFVGIGQFLSFTGLDELPQLINILRGEMSFVGPRPLPIKEAQQLDSSWDFRYLARPGVFSEWSLSPHRHDSLTAWKKLDKKTLSQGGIKYDLQMLWQNGLRVIKKA